MLHNALTVDKWDSAESQVMVRSVYHRYMESVDDDVNDNEIQRLEELVT